MRVKRRCRGAPLIRVATAPQSSQAPHRTLRFLSDSWGGRRRIRIPRRHEDIPPAPSSILGQREPRRAGGSAPPLPVRRGRWAPMRIDLVPDRPRQISYALKINVLRKPFSRSGPQRARTVRLRPPEFRAHMAHLAQIDLRHLLFGLRVRLDAR